MSDLTLIQLRRAYDAALEQIAAESFLFQGMAPQAYRLALRLGNNPGADPTAEDLQGKLRMTLEQAQAFESRYTIIDAYQNDATGFSAVALRDTANPNRVVIAVRSTEILNDSARDLGADLQLTVNGFAFDQILSAQDFLTRVQPQLLPEEKIDLVGASLSGNVVRTLAVMYPDVVNTDSGSNVVFNATGLGQFTDPEPAGQNRSRSEVLQEMMRLYRQVEDDPTSVTDTPLLLQPLRLTAIAAPPVNRADANGNIYPSPRNDFAEAYIRNKYSTSYNDFGATDPEPSFAQYYGTALSGFDTQAIANSGSHPDPIGIPIEGQPVVELPGVAPRFDYLNTHSLTLLTDSLRLHILFKEIDPTLAMTDIGNILQAASAASANTLTQKAEGDTLETALDVLRKALLPPDPHFQATPSSNSPSGFGNMANRTAFYANLAAVEAALPIPGTYRIETLVNRPVEEVKGTALLNDAEGKGLAYRYALKELNPFAIVGADYTARNAAGELNLFDPTTGLGGITNNYIADHAAFLEAKLDLTLNNQTTPSDPFTLTHYHDGASGFDVPAGIPTLSREYLFGGDQADTLTGSRFLLTDDHLYGGGGNDWLEGFGGDDYLEGDAGIDTLVGGAGNDTLEGLADADILDGGTGADTLRGGQALDEYVFRTGDGADTIEDSDGRGMLLFDDNLLTGGVHRDGDAQNVFFSTDSNRFLQYQELGNDLLITNRTSGDQIRIANFTPGEFGLRLVGEPSYDNGLPTRTDFQKVDHYEQVGIDPQGQPIYAPVYSPFFDDNGNDTTNIGGLGALTPPLNDDSNNLIHAMGGSDHVVGAAGNDQLFGEGDGDILYGGGGDDRLVGGDGNDWLFGDDPASPDQTGRDLLDGGDGDDQLFGNDGADILLGGIGNDHLEGDGLTHGNVGLNDDWLDGGDGDDELHGDAGADVLLGGAGKDLLIGDVTQYQGGLSEDGGNDILDGGADDDLLFGLYGDDTLSGGSGNDQLNGQDGNDVLYGGDGNDTLSGDLRINPINGLYDTLEYRGAGGNDFLDGGKGFDFLYGGEGDDTLLGGGSRDILYGDYNANLFPVGFSLAATGNDLLDGGNGNDELHGGAGNDTLIGGEGVDSLDGGEGEDILEGGTGDDFLDGGPGHDTYVFNLGDGVDTISDPDPASGNTLVFGPGISADALRLSFGSLAILVGDGSDRIHIEEFVDPADPSSGSLITTFQFADGTTLPPAQLLERGIDLIGTPDDDQLFVSQNPREVLALAGNDVVVGGFGDDVMDGGEGDDQLDGGLGNDVLRGGAGQDDLVGGEGSNLLDGGDGADVLTGGIGPDTLLGGAGNDELSDGFGGDDVLDGGPGADLLHSGSGHDTYVFGRGYGQDVVENQDFDGGDTVQITPDLTPSDVQGGRVNDDWVLEVVGTPDRLTVRSFFSDPPSQVAGVRFADGTLWDTERLIDLTLIGRAGTDHLQGFDNRNDTIVGSGANEVLNGLGGNDTLDGGAGQDVLNGGTGDDTYIWGPNSGHDTIFDQAGNDVIRLDAAIAPSDMAVLRAGHDLVLTVNGTGDALTVRDHFLDAAFQIEQVQFADGTAWDTATLAGLAQPVAGLSAPSVVPNAPLPPASGTGGSPTEPGILDAGVTLDGTGTADVLIGGSGTDTLDGHGGNDRLVGGAGNDTYLFGRGYDEDTIRDFDTTLGNVDVIQMAPDLSPADIAVSRGFGDEDLDLLLTVTGTNDQVKVERFFKDAAYRIEEVRFADRTTWDADILRDKTLIPVIGGPGNDTINTFNGANLRNFLVDGGAGDDTIVSGTDDHLIGGEGNDTLYAGLGTDVLDGGSGDDVLLGDFGWTSLGSKDVLNGGPGDDVLRGGGDNDVLDGGPGQDMLYGDDGNDLLDGGPGDDSLYGGDGSDTFLFGRGSGQDTVIDSGVRLRDWNVIQMAPDIQPTDVTVMRSTDPTMPPDSGLADLVLRINGTPDQLTVSGFFSRVSAQIQEVRYADGTVWDVDMLKEMTRTITGTADGDLLIVPDSIPLDAQFGVKEGSRETLIGLDGDDVLDGGGGADVLIGGPGNDTYVADSEFDTVIEAAGEGTDLVNSSVDYTLPDNVENLTLTGSVVLGTGNALDNVLIGNIGMNILSGGVGNDTLSGSQGGFGGGEGGGGGIADNDFLIGGAGDDTYLFALGNGVDTIVDTAALGEGNRVLFGPGISQTDLTFVRDQNTLTIALFAQGGGGEEGGSGEGGYFGGGEDGGGWGGNGQDAVVLKDFDPNGINGSLVVETLEFDDGTAINVADLFAPVGPVVTDGDDELAFGSGDDVVDALGGNDVVDGDGGNDTLFGGAGDDTLLGVEGDDTLAGGPGTDTLFGGPGDDTYFVDDAGDTIIELFGEGVDTVQSTVSHNLAANVENLTLAGIAAIDGTGNDLANILIGDSAANVLDGGEGSDTLVGGAGNDTLQGGAGDDTFRYGPGDGLDRVSDISGADVVQFGTGIDFDTTVVRLAQVAGEMVAHLRFLDASETETTDQGMDITLWADGTSPIESFSFANGTTLSLSDLTIRTVVTVGTKKGEVIRTGRYDDIIYSQNGNDLIYAGSGNDTVYAGNGGDTVYGEGGNDTLLGNNGKDYLDGGAGDDVLEGGNGDDALLGGDGKDFLTSDNGRDCLLGGAGDDQLSSGNGNDTLAGGLGNDLLDSGNGVDTILFGRGDGQDTLAGGKHNKHDAVQFGDDIQPLDVLLSRQVNDLRVVIYGTSDSFTVQDWYSDKDHRVGEFVAGDGQVLDDSRVDQLIQAMASFGAQTSLSWEEAVAQRPEDAQQILAASWK